MLIIAGHLIVDPDQRADYLSECVAVVEAARVAPGCLDFSITADTVDPSQIRIYECWEPNRTCWRSGAAGRVTTNRRPSSTPM